MWVYINIFRFVSEQKLQADLPVAYNQALLAGQQLVESSRALVVEPSSREAQVLLHTAAQGILEGTLKVNIITLPLCVDVYTCE